MDVWIDVDVLLKLILIMDGPIIYNDNRWTYGWMDLLLILFIARHIIDIDNGYMDRRMIDIDN